MKPKKKALILYATMTGNTEKIANWFKETFEYYQIEVTMLRMSFATNFPEHQHELYFDDYDIVCLGSSIVAGAPLKIVTKVLSLGGGDNLEASVQAKLDGKESTDGGEATMPPTYVDWRRHQPPYHGVLRKNNYRPFGIVFSTYGGGFYGSREVAAALETLKLYLELNDVDIIGTFCCCGRESGPAGLLPGQLPECTDPDITPEEYAKVFREPEVYYDADGNKHYGSFFHHSHMESKPGPRDEAKAKALIADIVEDLYFSYDGELKNPHGSQYISMS